MLAIATVAAGPLTTVRGTIKTISGDGSFVQSVTYMLRIPVDTRSLGGMRWNTPEKSSDADCQGQRTDG